MPIMNEAMAKLPARITILSYTASLQIANDGRVRYRDVKTGAGVTEWMSPEELLGHLLRDSERSGREGVYVPTVFGSRGRLHWLQRKTSDSGSMYRYVYYVAGEDEARPSCGWHGEKGIKQVYRINKGVVGAEHHGVLDEPEGMDELPEETVLYEKTVVIERAEGQVRYKGKETGLPITIWKTPEAMRALLDRENEPVVKVNETPKGRLELAVQLSRVEGAIQANMSKLRKLNDEIARDGHRADIAKRRSRAATLERLARVERDWIALAEKIAGGEGE